MDKEAKEFKKHLMKLMRICLIGKENGPSVPWIMSILGKEETLKRIRDMLERITIENGNVENK